MSYPRSMHIIKREVETGAVTIICIYVDDILFMGNNPSDNRSHARLNTLEPKSLL
jgi:hypothetical protein